MAARDQPSENFLSIDAMDPPPFLFATLSRFQVDNPPQTSRILTHRVSPDSRFAERPSSVYILTKITREDKDSSVPAKQAPEARNKLVQPVKAG